MDIGKMVSGILLAFIAVMFVLNFVPVLETEIVTTNVTNTFVAAMLDMSVWIIPAVAVVGVILAIVKSMRGD